MKLIRVLFYRADRPVLRADDDPRGDARDMLRYDFAFVDPADPTLVAFPTFKNGLGDVRLDRRVTPDRWASFDVRLTRTDPPIDGTSRHAEWITYRHPRDAYGRLDYGKLVPVTLAAFLDAKRAEDVR